MFRRAHPTLPVLLLSGVLLAACSGDRAILELSNTNDDAGASEAGALDGGEDSDGSSDGSADLDGDDAPDVAGNEEGKASEAEAAPDELEPGMARVQVYFNNDDREDVPAVFAVDRDVDATAPLGAALRALLAGPTAAEGDAGFSSFFSSETADLLAGVDLQEGRAHVAFDPSLPDVIPNASTSAGSASFLGALDATVTQFATVDEVVYSLDGDVDAFYAWLQMVTPDA